MTKRPNPVLDDLPLYLNRYVQQFRWNFELPYYIVGGALMQAAVCQTVNIWFVLASLIQYFLVGLAAVIQVTRRVDRAFQSLPIDYVRAGYGKPRWVIEGPYPFKEEILKITASGFAEADFQQYKDHIASRLRMPVSSIRKPSANDPHIYVSVKKVELPSFVSFKSLDLGKLDNGEFYLGQTEQELRKTSLTSMIHMLVAGQTGSGKTQFLKQMLTTLLARTRQISVCLIDMKGGIDFQEFMDIKSVKFATKYKEANDVLDALNNIYDERTKIILEQGKQKWSEVNTGEIRKREEAAGRPIGPIVLIVDEVAELSKQATKSAAHSDLQEKIARLARLARVTGIHLVLGTQRPDVKVLSSQSKDNIPTKVCFSVPTVAASNVVIGNMMASTLGGHPGRAVVIDRATMIAQTPLISRGDLDRILEPIRKRQEDQPNLFALTTQSMPEGQPKPEERSNVDDAKPRPGNDKPFQ